MTTQLFERPPAAGSGQRQYHRRAGCSTARLPPVAAARLADNVRPRPRPCSPGLVVKNGSNRCLRASGSMPWPLSRTCRRYLPSASWAFQPQLRHRLCLHGIEGVADQVDQDLLQARLVDLHWAGTKSRCSVSGRLSRRAPSTWNAASTALPRLASPWSSPRRAKERRLAVMRPMRSINSLMVLRLRWRYPARRVRGSARYCRTTCAARPGVGSIRGRCWWTSGRWPPACLLHQLILGAAQGFFGLAALANLPFEALVAGAQVGGALGNPAL